jgi:hypothetical protein
MSKNVSRKKRSDRNHVIYLITNVLTGHQYIGITAATGRDLELVYEVNVLDVVRGKEQAHLKEMELVKKYKPTLNTK